MAAVLRRLGIETHLVMTRSAQITLAYETPLKLADVHALATVVYKAEDIGASISSGSFRTMGMLVAPCSIRSLSEIATGVTERQFLVIEAEQVEHRGVQIVDMDGLVDCPETDVIGRAVSQATRC